MSGESTLLVISIVTRAMTPSRGSRFLVPLVTLARVPMAQCGESTLTTTSIAAIWAWTSPVSVALCYLYARRGLQVTISSCCISSTCYRIEPRLLRLGIAFVRASSSLQTRRVPRLNPIVPTGLLLLSSANAVDR